MDKINMFFCAIVCWFTLLIHNGVQGQTNSKGCSKYGYTIWISCLTDPCLFASCPAFGKLAECRKEKTNDCNTCRAAFFVNGKRVNCHPQNFECPPGLKLQECRTDPCKSTECRDDRFKDAECRGYYCGGCLAEYFVDSQWRQCPTPDVKLQGDAPLLLPEIRQAMSEFSSGSTQAESRSALRNTCEDGSPEPECPDVCAMASCPQYSRATCVINKCQGCKAEFYFRGQLVNCLSTKCRPNVLEMSCPDDPCNYVTCPAYPSAECRPNNCGSCQPEWFINGKKVNCYSKMPDNYTCPGDLKPVKCPRNTCRFRRCLTDTNTHCRVYNCGGCYTEYIKSNGEPSECVGWWSKYETKKPKELLEISCGPVTDLNTRTGTGTRTVSSGKSQPITTTHDKTLTDKDKEQRINALFGDLGLEVPINSNIVRSGTNSKLAETIPRRRPRKIVRIKSVESSNTWSGGNPNTRSIPKPNKPLITESNTLASSGQNTWSGIETNVGSGPKANTWSNQQQNKMSDDGKNPRLTSELRSSSGPGLDTVSGQELSPLMGPEPTKLVIQRRPRKIVRIRPVEPANRFLVPQEIKPKNQQQSNTLIVQKERKVVQPQGQSQSVKTVPLSLQEHRFLDLFKPVSISLDSLNSNTNFRPGVPISGFGR